MDPLRVLLVGNDRDAVGLLTSAAEASGALIVGTASGLDVAVSQLHTCDTVIVDRATLVNDDLSHLLAAAAHAPSPVPCLVGLVGGSIEDAVDLMRRGAFAVVSLPVTSEDLALHLGHAAKHRELLKRNGELEKSLEASERLAMIGKLAAGVAHELNNPLDGVLRYVNFAIAKLPQEAVEVTYLLQARQGLRRMADIVRDLLQFSRNANVDNAGEDAERLARDAVEQIVAAATGRTIETRYEFPPEGVHVPRAVFQVLGNLAKNAVDAMPHGGKLSVGATVASGRVKLFVRDTGGGIPAEIRERVFEPFFTTKEVGKGTGLGLSISQRIVERLGGTLTIETETDQGTTAFIEVPVRPLGQRVPSQRARAAATTSMAASKSEGVF